MKIIISVLLISFLTACATGSSLEVLAPELVDKTDKNIVILNVRDKYIRMLEKELRKKGFKIKKFASTKRVSELMKPTRVESYNNAEARYAIEVNYQVNAGRQCFGGGASFNYFIVELSDLKSNEIILIREDSGYSEKCPPLSGKIFENSANAINSLWK